MVFCAWRIDGAYGVTDMGDFSGHTFPEFVIKNRARGMAGAFAAGILGGIFSSPCSTPVLIALLAIVAGKGNLFWGIWLMFLYSIGHSILVVAAGTSIGFVKKISAGEKYDKLGAVLKAVMGAAILLIGFYMFWLAF